MNRSPRAAALAVLLRVERGGYSNLALSAGLRGFPPREQAFARALVYGVLKNRVAIDDALRRFSHVPPAKLDPEVLEILRMGVCQLAFLGGVEPYAAVNESVSLERRPHLRGYLNGVLRAAARALEKGPLPSPDPEKDPDGALSVKTSCPLPLLRLWRRDYGDGGMRRIAASLRAPDCRFARLNPLRLPPQARPDGLPALLRSWGLKGSPMPFPPDCVRLDSLPELEQNAAFQKGLFHIQGFGSQLCCEFLGARPGESVLDLCAAPGGKSFTAAERMQNRGRVVACELHPARLALIESGARRLGIDIVRARQNDASRPCPALGMFDRVLCDVPCSGLGVLNGKPEIRYRPLSASAGLPKLQLAILREGAAHVKPGGVLVYSTCTLRRAENDGVADAFLRGAPGFSPLPLPPACGADGHRLTLLPEAGRPEGFFIARFVRRPRTENEAAEK